MGRPLPRRPLRPSLEKRAAASDRVAAPTALTIIALAAGEGQQVPGCRQAEASVSTPQRAQGTQLLRRRIDGSGLQDLPGPPGRPLLRAVIGEETEDLPSGSPDLIHLWTDHLTASWRLGAPLAMRRRLRRARRR